MNPIYRFELSKDGANTQAAKPNYSNDLAIEYELEQNEEFYRGKLSGKLTFQKDDFTYIKTAAFDTQFDVEIFISYDAGQTWASYWKGKFFKTDCEFNDDDQTAIVTPTLNDRYNDVLAGLEKEFNLIDLAPEIQPVKLQKRPMIQIYFPGQSVVGCFLSGMWWEQECDVVEESDTVEVGGQTLNKLTQYLHFYPTKKSRIAVLNRYGHGASFPVDTFIGTQPDPITGDYTFTNGNYSLVVTTYELSASSWERYYELRDGDTALYRGRELFVITPPDAPPKNVTLWAVAESGAVGAIDVVINDVNVYARYVTDVQSVGSTTAYPIPADDMVENNRNYHYVLGYDFPDTIVFATGLSDTPTKWGIYQPGKYYEQPSSIYEIDFYPIARATWGRISIWFSQYVFDWIVEQNWRKDYVLKDAYPISSVISVLLGQISVSTTHDGTTDYSQFLYAKNNPITNVPQTLLISPKSNAINSGYDQPAQKAPITLKDVLNMLRDCFRCYWFIDENNKFRIEHISWFMNGGTYTPGTPSVGIDLTKEIVSRNGKPWSYARNQYQFDKPDMAARYQFGWMDDVTEPFEGSPIDIISKYVNPDNIENIDIAQFTSDIDYILLQPNTISKDGFVLLGAINIPATPYDLSSYTILNRRINENNGKWGTSTTYKHICIPVSADRQITVVADGSNTAQIAWLTSNEVGAGGEVPPFVDGTTLIIQDAGTTETYTVPVGATYLYVYFGTASAYANKPQSISLLPQDVLYQLPYLIIGSDNNNRLQNGYMAFIFLQNYYVYDMPAKNFSIDGVPGIALGIKKLKRQTLKFPVLNEPNMTELVKTGLGNGTIQKMSVNLSSRNANVTLKYDTE